MTETNPERATPERDEDKRPSPGERAKHHGQPDGPKATPTADPNVDPANDWPAA